MLHQPPPSSGSDPASSYKARLGMGMFLVYCAVYTGFVMAAIVNEGEAMQSIVFSGLNLATVYGFGLIALALVQALIYNHLCTRKEQELAGHRDQEGGV